MNVKSMSRIGLAVVLLWVGAAWSEAPAPDVLIKTVTQEVLEIVSKDQDIQKGDTKKIMSLVETKVLPHFNFEGMTALAMGANWRKADAAQKARLTEAFKTLLVRTYASAIASYKDQTFEFRPLRAKPTDIDVTVNVRVLRPGTAPVTIDYDMEKTPKGWKAYNVHVAGTSLVINYRTDFANQVRRTGIDGLLSSLEAKNASLQAESQK